MSEGLNEHEAWRRVEDTYARYQEAFRHHRLEDPELSRYRQAYIEALRHHREIIRRIKTLHIPPDEMEQ